MNSGFNLIEKMVLFMPLAIFFCAGSITALMDINNKDFIVFAFLMTFLAPVITYLSLLFRSSHINKGREFLNKYGELIVIFYISMCVGLLGYTLGVSYKGNAVLLKNGTAFSAISLMFFLAWFSILVAWSVLTESKANKFALQIINDNSTPIRDFLKIAKEKQANILAAAGNLYTLRTEAGTELLREFLLNDPKNQLELFIPEASKKYLTTIKQNLNDNVLSERVTIQVISPFVFLQGIVFAGEKMPSTTTEQVRTKGYYLYQPLGSKRQVYTENGIFVDLSDIQNEQDELCVAIRAHYFHLKGLDHTSEGTTFMTGLIHSDTKEKKNYHVGDAFKLSEWSSKH